METNILRIYSSNGGRRDGGPVLFVPTETEIRYLRISRYGTAKQSLIINRYNENAYFELGKGAVV